MKQSKLKLKGLLLSQYQKEEIQIWEIINLKTVFQKMRIRRLIIQICIQITTWENLSQAMIKEYWENGLQDQ